MLKLLHTSLILAALVSLYSCTQTPSRSVPVLTPEQVARVPSPIPRDEPRSKYGNPANYEVFGVGYQVMDSARGYDQQGKASWYGPGFHGKLTSTREEYDMYAMTAAHKSLPLPCYVEVTNLLNGRQIVVRVNDRGPFVEGRIIDLSYVAAQKLDMVEAGTAHVRVRALTSPTRQVLNYEKLQGDPGLAKGALHVEQQVPQNVVVAPESSVIETPAVYQAPAASYYLQVGAFSEANNAYAFQAKLSQQTSHAVIVLADEYGALHRVQVGPLDNEAAAQRARQQFINLGYKQPKIIRGE